MPSVRTTRRDNTVIVFFLIDSLVGYVPRCRPAVGILEHYITDSTAAVLNHSSHSLEIGCEDFFGCFSVVNQSVAVQNCGAHALQDLNTTCDGSLILNFTVELMVFGHSWRF